MITAEAIAHCDGDDIANQRIGTELGDLRERDVSRRDVDVENAGENQLQRTSLRAYHQIDARRIPFQAFVEGGGKQQQKRDRRYAQHQQRQVEQGRERAFPRVRVGDASKVHAAALKSKAALE